MKNKLSRRDFVIKSAYSLLPLFSIAIIPNILKATTIRSNDCNNSCINSCSGDCSGGCSGSCDNRCEGCGYACSNSCISSCSGSNAMCN